MSKPKQFTIDARTILALGRDSIKDHTTALLELVKNSYDADARKVVIEIFCKQHENFIRVADTGCGMDEEEVDNNWLRIGYSEKRSKKISKLKRRKTGEKGIGRISADRLGAILMLITKARNNNAFGIKVNWDDFNTEGKDLSSIPIKVINNPKINLPQSNGVNSDSGTELIIKDLRQKWTKDDISNLYNELSILTPPFKKVADFELYLDSDVTNEYNGVIKSPFLQTAEIELNAEFDGKNIVYSIKDKYEKGQRQKKEQINWKHLVQKASDVEQKPNENYPQFGNVRLSLLFYPREAKLLQGTSFSLTDLREFLDTNAGVKIYRDNIRVKPYGNPDDPEGDWLGLAERKTREPAGVSRPTYKVSANQIVGAVFVSRDKNPKLIDSSSREGLIHEDAFNDLRTFVLGCLRLLETYRHHRQKDKMIDKQITTSAVEDVKDLNKELKSLKKDLTTLSAKTYRSSDKPIRRTLDRVDTVSEKIKITHQRLDELVTESRVLRGLATIGIASAVFGHETQSSIAEFISATYATSVLLKKTPPKCKSALGELDKAITYANHVSSWGSFALARIQRDKRRKKKQNIKKVIDNTLKDVEAVFKAINIEINAKSVNVIEGRTFAMDIESILLNLMTNAYTACKQVSRSRKIRVEAREKTINKIRGFELIVSDSGPGIGKKFVNKIWEPLFTTKHDKEGKEGTGLGLSIVKSIVEDLKGTKEVDIDPKLKGARFRVWTPLN